MPESPIQKKELKENAKALTNRIRQVTYVVDENMSSSQREPSDRNLEKANGIKDRKAKT